MRAGRSGRLERAAHPLPVCARAPRACRLASHAAPRPLGAPADNAKFSPDDKGFEEYVDGTFGHSSAGLGGRAPALTQAEAGWDGSSMRYVPYSLRGLKPVTNEPWARDEAVYRKNDGMDEIDDEFAPSTHDRFLTDNTWDASAKPPSGAMKAYPQ